MNLGGMSMQPLVVVVGIAAISLLPMLLLGATSFVKLHVVFGILRNALGGGQLPSAMITGLLATVLTFFTMAPVGQQIWQAVETKLPAKAGSLSFEQIKTLFVSGVEPLDNFLRKHSRERERKYFAEVQAKNLKLEGPEISENFSTLLPSFLLTELDEAFSMGFVLFLPFLVIDLLVSNILMGLGMVMVSPHTISLPLKIILFVMSDGWFLLCKSLLEGYQ